MKRMRNQESREEENTKQVREEKQRVEMRVEGT